MIMSNFISEEERHEELYGLYSERHQQILNIFENLMSSISDKKNIYNDLVRFGIQKSEIEWLKRTGHYFPDYG